MPLASHPRDVFLMRLKYGLTEVTAVERLGSQLLLKSLSCGESLWVWICSRRDPAVPAASSCFSDKSRGKRGSWNSAGDALARRAMPVARRLGGDAVDLATGIPAGCFFRGCFTKILQIAGRSTSFLGVVSSPSLAHRSFSWRRQESCQQWGGLQESPVATGFNRGAALPRTGRACLSEWFSPAASVARQHLGIVATNNLQTTHRTPAVRQPLRAYGALPCRLSKGTHRQRLSAKQQDKLNQKHSSGTQGENAHQLWLMAWRTLTREKQRLLSLRGAMKNELGPLLGEGTQENLSFWRRCPLSPCKRRRGRKSRGGRESEDRKERGLLVGWL